MRSTTGVLLAAAFLWAAPAPKVHWASSIPDGLREAKEKGVPLLVALNMDDERGNEAMVEKVYTDPAFVAAAAKCVCTIGSMGSHEQVSDPERKRKVCAKFGSLSCAEHQGVERVIRTDFLKVKVDVDVNSPQHFFLAPDGRRLFQRTWTLDAKELAALMARARELCAPESLAAFDTKEARLARAADPLRPVRAAALRDLSAMKDPDVDARLAAMAKGASDEVACDVLEAFAGAMTPERAALAASLLAAKTPAVRMQAAVAVEASKGPDAAKTLGAALAKERDDGVRGVLYRAVAGSAPGDAAARGLLLGGLKEKADVLPHVLVALAPWAKDPEVVAPITAIAFGKDPWRVRAAACWTLGMSGKMDLAPALRDIKDVGKRSSLAHVAKLAARRLDGDFDEAEYRRALRSFAWSPVRHPGDPEE